MNNIKWIDVESSNVNAIGYNENNQEVYIRFNNGTTYKYSNVPIQEFEGLKNAPSIGSYLHRNIKGSYPYERVD